MVKKLNWKDRVVKGYSAFKDFMVRDNFGIHLLTFYALYDLIGKLDMVYGFIISMLIIILVEIIDKYLLRTFFSIKDVIAGFIGLLLVIIKYIILTNYLT